MKFKFQFHFYFYFRAIFAILLLDVIFWLQTTPTMSADSPEQNALVPYEQKAAGKMNYFWTTCVAKPSAIFITRTALVGSQLGSLISQCHSRIFSKLPEVNFNCDIRANFSIKSKPSDEEKEKQERCQKIAELEKEVYLLRSKLVIRDFGNMD